MQFISCEPDAGTDGLLLNQLSELRNARDVSRPPISVRLDRDLNASVVRQVQRTVEIELTLIDGRSGLCSHVAVPVGT